MKPRPKAIHTEVGVLNGRDVIFLDSVEYNLSTLRFEGEFTASLASAYQGKEEDISYILVFTGVMYYAAWELDLYPNDRDIESSFDKVENSPLLKTLKNSGSEKMTDQHQHFVLSTYDDVYEIVALDYCLTILPDHAE
jgi:hypothetical protein